MHWLEGAFAADSLAVGLAIGQRRCVPGLTQAQAGGWEAQHAGQGRHIQATSVRLLELEQEQASLPQPPPHQGQSLAGTAS